VTFHLKRGTIILARVFSKFMGDVFNRVKFVGNVNVNSLDAVSLTDHNFSRASFLPFKDATLSQQVTLTTVIRMLSCHGTKSAD